MKWRLNNIPLGVWGLGMVTFFMNASTIIIISLAPIYLVNHLKISVTYLGFIDGFSEFIAWFMRIFSGVISDFFYKRKLILVFAYGIITLTRPFIMIPKMRWYVFAKIIDRVGNGLQASPREALVGDLAQNSSKGACYGLRFSLALLGSFLGGCLTIVLMSVTSENYKIIFGISSILPFLAIITLLFFVYDVPYKKRPEKTKYFSLTNFSKLTKDYWKIVIVGAFFMLSNYSGSWMILRANELGMSAKQVPVVFIIQNILAAFSTYPIARLSDYIGRTILLAVVFSFVIIANIFFYCATDIWMVLVGAGLWGLQIGPTQSLLVVSIADSIPKDIRATGFGIYYFIVAIALFISNEVSGIVWERVGSIYVFLISAVIATLALLSLILLKKNKSYKI